MPLGFTNVYILKDGEQYADVQKFCPNGDGYELTRIDGSDPRKVWYLETCPIDAVVAAAQSAVQFEVGPLFDAFATVSDHQKHVLTVMDLAHTVIATWLLTNPAFLEEHANYVIDRGLVRAMIYTELKRLQDITEITSMNPPG